MKSLAKADALLRDVKDKLEKRFSNSATIDTFRSARDAHGWPMLFLSLAGAEAASNAVIALRIKAVDMVSKDIFGNDLDAYAPHNFEVAYELGAAPGSFIFTVSAANASVGAIYQHVATGRQFVVGATIVGATTLVSVGNMGLPAASGNLALVSGSGDATIVYSAFASQLIAGPTNPLVQHSNLFSVLWEVIKTGVKIQIKEIAAGTAVTEANMDAAVAVAEIDELYWPTKSV